MLLQITIGSSLILSTVLFAVAAWWLTERVLLRLRGWVLKPPHMPKMMVVVGISITSILLMLSVAVWSWAFTFLILGLFPTLEAAVYFSLVSFTTLGFGDVLLADEWRLLGGMTAANGFFSFGMLTAMLVETFRNIRLRVRDETLS